MLPPWLNVTPDLQLRAAQAGTAAGTDIARMRQQSALAEMQAQQQADEFRQRIMSDQVRNGMDRALRLDLGKQDQALAIQKLNQVAGHESAVNKIREGELQLRRDQMSQKQNPLSLQELLDPKSGERLGVAAGNNVLWNRESEPKVSYDPVTGERNGTIIDGRFHSLPREGYLEKLMREGGGSGASTNASTAAFAPVPKSKSDLKVGVVYQTNQGPLKWNGSKFVAQ